MKDTSAMPELKKAAALQAAALVKSGQKVGLGTGSTAAFAIEELGRRRREEGLQIECVATSFQSMVLARQAGLPLLLTQNISELDLSIDGADEIDPRLCLIKGGGGAHTQEKLVHAMSANFIVVADHTKQKSRLGESFAVPVEILADALEFAGKKLLELGAREVNLRSAVKKDGPVITDNGHLILDARFDIDNPSKLEKEIDLIPGVLENGIFADDLVRPHLAYIAAPEGVQFLEAGSLLK